MCILVQHGTVLTFFFRGIKTNFSVYKTWLEWAFVLTVLYSTDSYTCAFVLKVYSTVVLC